MAILVESEVGALRRVLVHRPGPEIDRMVPALMERLLFDDILDGGQAREEHDLFRRVLEKAGAETLDPLQLLEDILARPEARSQMLDELEQDYGLTSEQRGRLDSLEPTHLAAAMISGVRSEDERLVSHRRQIFELDPVPNYFFQRDPQVVLGDRVIVSSMATAAREREPFLAHAIFEYHPALQGAAGLFSIDSPASYAPEFELDYPYPHLEGGDVLIPHRELLLVGLSARTNMQGVQLLADYLRDVEAPFRHLLAVQLPAKRSYMHLDTVFTFIDRSTCLGYLPVVAPGRAESARVYHVDLTADEVAFAPRPSLRAALAEVGPEIELVPCGGPDDLVAQQREQWTDGANALALAPGVITLYRRNRATVEELKRRGWRILDDRQALADGTDLLGQGPTVITLRDHELSRARGGPRCMSMPLERDALEA
jgi:arginine deiminase